MPEPLSPSELNAYLARIGHPLPPVPDQAGLAGLHRAHTLAIPFENIDVQLGTPPGRDPAAIFDKLVTRRRGGWCYEQNGLFGRALAALGFAVSPLAAGVTRDAVGEAAIGTHLCLKVEIDGQEWLADVGFGSTLIEPLPLRDHAWNQGALTGTLGPAEDGHLRMAIITGPMPLSYVFRNELAQDGVLDSWCTWQGTDSGSIFVQNLVVQRRLADGHLMLRGKVLTETTPAGSTVRELASANELVAVVNDRFGLDVPQVAGLWDQVEARHAALFAEAG